MRAVGLADYQAALLLRDFEELSAEETARRMGRTAGAVRMLQMRALTALRGQPAAERSSGMSVLHVLARRGT